MRSVFCVCCIFSSCVLAVQNENPAGGAAIDQCAPIVTDQDLQSLNEIASHPTDYILPGTKLSKQDLRAMQHLVEESKVCGRKFISDIPEMDSLLYVMDLKAIPNGPISPVEVNMLRQVELTGAALTAQEKTSLASAQPHNLSEFDRASLHKYIDLAKQRNGLVGFSLFMRLQILQIIIQNLGQGFSLEDLAILRRNTLGMMGLSNQEISTLDRLSHLANGSGLTGEEVALLEKWILIENVFPAYALMDFEKFSSLHLLIQDQSSPPFSAQAIRNDQKAFQKASKQIGFIVISPRGMHVLQDLIKHRGEYIQGTLQLGPEQIDVGNNFLLAMLQFGQVPGLDPAEIGEVLELMQRRSEFQNQENIQRVVVMESIKNGFTWQQKEAFQELIARSQSPLSQKDVSLLKMYILKAKDVGGLNGFNFQERAILLSIIQNNMNKYFTPSDVAVLRQTEVQNTDLPDENLSSTSELSKRLEAQQIQQAPEEPMNEQMQQALREQQSMSQMPAFSPPPSPGPRGPPPARAP